MRALEGIKILDLSRVLAVSRLLLMSHPPHEPNVYQPLTNRRRIAHKFSAIMGQKSSRWRRVAKGYGGCSVPGVHHDFY